MMKGMNLIMANNRRMTPQSFLLRYLVLPALFLCAIFRQQVILQWIALGAVLVWLIAGLASLIKKQNASKRIQKNQENLSRIRNPEPKSEPMDAEWQPAESAEQNLLLIRQVNFRITDLLKQTYPMISWLWVKRPSIEELTAGGTWRIQTDHTEPFNYAEVTMSAAGQMKITMLQATPLDETSEVMTESEDLKPEEVSDRENVRDWYSRTGEDILTTLIDDLNTQGHKELVIRENGEVYVVSGSANQMVDRVPDFPPRMVWEDFGSLLKEDDINAVSGPEGLQLTW
jgi:hypothetical protein